MLRAELQNATQNAKQRKAAARDADLSAWAAALQQATTQIATFAVVLCKIAANEAKAECQMEIDADLLRRSLRHVKVPVCYPPQIVPVNTDPVLRGWFFSTQPSEVLDAPSHGTLDIAFIVAHQLGPMVRASLVEKGLEVDVSEGYISLGSGPPLPVPNHFSIAWSRVESPASSQPEPAPESVPTSDTTSVAGNQTPSVAETSGSTVDLNGPACMESRLALAAAADAVAAHASQPELAPAAGLSTATLAGAGTTAMASSPAAQLRGGSALVPPGAMERSLSPARVRQATTTNEDRHSAGPRWSTLLADGPSSSLPPQQLPQGQLGQLQHPQPPQQPPPLPLPQPQPQPRPQQQQQPQPSPAPAPVVAAQRSPPRTPVLRARSITPAAGGVVTSPGSPDVRSPSRRQRVLASSSAAALRFNPGDVGNEAAQRASVRVPPRQPQRDVARPRSQPASVQPPTAPPAHSAAAAAASAAAASILNARHQQSSTNSLPSTVDGVSSGSDGGGGAQQQRHQLAQSIVQSPAPAPAQAPLPSPSPRLPSPPPVPDLSEEQRLAPLGLNLQPRRSLGSAGNRSSEVQFAAPQPSPRRGFATARGDAPLSARPNPATPQQASRDVATPQQVLREVQTPGRDQHYSFRTLQREPPHSVMYRDLRMPNSPTSLQRRRDGFIGNRREAPVGNLVQSCGVCHEDRPMHSLSPCGHLLCGACSTNIRSCPFCRSSVHGRQVLFAP